MWRDERLAPSSRVAVRGRPALHRLVLDYRELRRAYFCNVLLGEPGDSFECGLQLRVILSHLRLAGFGGNSHPGASPRPPLPEWFPNHPRIPTFPTPGIPEPPHECWHRQRGGSPKTG